MARRGRRCQIMLPIAAAIASTATTRISVAICVRRWRPWRLSAFCSAACACGALHATGPRPGRVLGVSRGATSGGAAPGGKQDVVGARVGASPRAGVVVGGHDDRARRPADVRRERREAQHQSGPGAGSVKALPMRRWCSLRQGLGEHGPAARPQTPALALAERALDDLRGGQQRRRVARRGDHPDPALTPVQQAAAVDAHGVYAGEPLRAWPAGRRSNGAVLSRL